MANKAEGTLIVQFVVTIGGTTYTPGKYTLSGKAYEELSAAPYVREATKEEIEVNKNYQKKVAAARKAKGMKIGKEEKETTSNGTDTDINTGADTNTGEAGTGAEEVNTFTIEELEALSEEDLRALYAAEQAKINKVAPPNIGVKTIITNLTK